MVGDQVRILITARIDAQGDMGLRNGPDEFGLVTRIIHWTMMLLIIGQLALGLRIGDLEPGLTNLWLYGLHKTIGFLVLALIWSASPGTLSAPHLPPRPSQCRLLGGAHHALGALRPP